jgi:membrane-associated PAP2 superfamily phosphatase
MKKRIFLNFLIPVGFLLLVTIPFWVTDADLAFSRLFYTQGKGWPHGDADPWRFLYEYGNVPALVLAGGGLLVLLLGLVSPRFAARRKVGLFLVLFILLGPGLIVNVLFKDHWGRPRPADIKVFGGTGTFLPLWAKGEAGQGKSFPSGHASVGFFLFAPFFFLRYRARGRAFSFLGLGIFYGLLLGLGRIVQGGHFLSDVLWSGGFTYLTGLILSYLFRFHPTPPDTFASQGTGKRGPGPWT